MGSGRAQLEGQSTALREPRVRLLRTKQAAAYLGMSPWALRQEVQRGELGYISSGDNTSAWRFDIHDLDAWIERHRIGAR